jgi:hypothetical protein
MSGLDAERAAVERELALYRNEPVPEFMAEAVSRRIERLTERLAELGRGPGAPAAVQA